MADITAKNKQIKTDLDQHMGEEGACTPNYILKDQMECLKQAPAL